MVAVGLHIELGLKCGSTTFADWLWSVIAPALAMKKIPDLLDTNSTNSQASHMPTSSHHTPVGYARCEKQKKITCDYLD